MFSRLALALLLALAACADLTRPYQGHPGSTAERLAKPPPARVAVPPSYSVYLPNLASKPYSAAVAKALQEQEVPAVADYTRSGDWEVKLGASLRENMTVPLFTVIDPRGNRKGTGEGKPVPTDLWEKARPDIIRQAAEDGAVHIIETMRRAESARLRMDPNSLYHRSAKVMVEPVTGAPGDGNFTLSRLMREKLAKLGPTVQDSPTDADFILSGKVEDVPLTPKTRRVEIVWLLHDDRKNEVGHIVQLNEVPNGQLDKYWGDVAAAVTEEASVAVRDVILTQSGRR